MSERIYQIPARDVVPGMLWYTDDYGSELVTHVTQYPGDRVAVDVVCSHAIGVQASYFRSRDEQVLVRLLGPSPRELLCTCANHMPWAPNPGDPPADHWNRDWWPECTDPCPVAPNLDLGRGPIHGGLRLWPVPVNGYAWEWAERKRLYGTRDPSAIMHVYPDGIEAVCRHGRWSDALLAAFYHPPIVPDLPTALEQRPTPWAPYHDEDYR